MRTTEFDMVLESRSEEPNTHLLPKVAGFLLAICLLPTEVAAGQLAQFEEMPLDPSPSPGKASATAV
jgi:hypothetical protein